MFDSHAHVSFFQFDADREEIIQRAREAGLNGWLEVGTDIEQSKKAIALAEQEDGVFATVGVHPSDVASITQETWTEVRQLLQNNKVKAIGEVGLDFYRGGDAEDQKQALWYFIQIAQEVDLPIVFHVRSGPDLDAHEELLYTLSSLPTDQRPQGVIHTYSGTKDQARRYLELGLYLSFSGVVTFDNAQPVVEAAKWAPLDRMLIETDCPFLAPAPYRGKRNEPSYVRLVAEKIATIKSVAPEKVVEQTEKNAHELFRIG